MSAIFDDNGPAIFDDACAEWSVFSPIVGGGLFFRSNLYEGNFVFELTTTGPDETFTLPLIDEGTHDFVIDWGDGTTSEITSFDDADITHTYTVAGDYQVKITGTIGGWSFNGVGDKDKITDIRNWGPFPFLSDGAFKGCTNLQISATDGPTVMNLKEAFQDCPAIEDVDVSKWDTENVTDMDSTFNGAVNCNPLGMFFWKILNLLTASKFLLGAALAAREYDRTISSWALQNPPNPVSVNFGDSIPTENGPVKYAKKVLRNSDWDMYDASEPEFPNTLGEFFQGGYYGGSITIGGVDYYLICSGLDGQTLTQWKTSTTSTPGSGDTNDGYQNTMAQIANSAINHPAANFCNELSLNGYSDWYLPSINELLVLYSNRGALAAAGADFNSTLYWASNEVAYDKAQQIIFPGGHTYYHTTKTKTYLARAIRRIVA